MTLWMGLRVPYATTFGAVAVTVWMGGWRPAALVAVLGFSIATFYFVEPVGKFDITDIDNVLTAVLFCISTTIIILLGENMRRARDRARAAETELKARAEHLQQADANRARFLAILSHELRNPLAPLRTGLALLKAKRDEKYTAETYAMMERQIAHLTRLIDDLLDISRIDQGKLELKREKVAIAAVVRGAVEAVRPNIEAKSQQLEVQHAQAPLYVEGDPTRLSQVVANLLHNASKFTPSESRIELATEPESGDVLITVKDHGIGIAPEHLRAVFDMFVQLDASKSEATGGLGLGLNLVRTLVALHGGTVEARSDGIGKGSEFIVRLPLAQAPTVESPVKPAQRAAATQRRVLVVDDNPDAVDSLSDLLRIEGHEVRPAYGGEQALECAREFRPDVAFIDLNMPGLDGFEVARRIRAESWGKPMMLVALTGMGQQSEVEQTRQAGYDYHLTKPALPDQVLRLAAGQ